MREKYRIIYADPPWQYDNSATGGTMTSGAAQKYPTMSVEEIAALPIKSIAAPDSTLFMWGTWPKLNAAIPVMEGWGFKYKTVGFVWIKTNRKSLVEQFSFLPTDSFDDFFGLGHWTRGNTEFCLIGVKGKPRRVAADVKQIIYSPLQEHSRKPAETRHRIVRLMGNLPRVELFAREATEGWDVWGNQVESTVELLSTEAA